MISNEEYAAAQVAQGEALVRMEMARRDLAALPGGKCS